MTARSRIRPEAAKETDQGITAIRNGGGTVDIDGGTVSAAHTGSPVDTLTATAVYAEKGVTHIRGGKLIAKASGSVSADGSTNYAYGINVGTSSNKAQVYLSGAPLLAFCSPP